MARALLERLHDRKAGRKAISDWAGLTQREGDIMKNRRSLASTLFPPMSNEGTAEFATGGP